MREVPVEVGGVLSVTLFRRFLVLVLALIVLGMGAVSISAVQAAQSVQAKPKTPTRAELKAFKARAEQGDAGAACQLGTIYRNGQVVRTDYAEAYKWYTIGFWLSHDFENTCADDRGRLRKLIPAEEVAGGLDRALKWGHAAGFTLAVPQTPVKPEYTRKAMEAKITGDVSLEVAIGVDGTIVQYRIVRSLDEGLDQEAIKAVQRWRFAPATLHGTPVPMLADMVLNFDIK